MIFQPLFQGWGEARLFAERAVAQTAIADGSSDRKRTVGERLMFYALLLSPNASRNNFWRLCLMNNVGRINVRPKRARELGEIAQFRRPRAVKAGCRRGQNL